MKKTKHAQCVYDATATRKKRDWQKVHPPDIYASTSTILRFKVQHEYVYTNKCVPLTSPRGVFRIVQK